MHGVQRSPSLGAWLCPAWLGVGACVDPSEMMEVGTALYSWPRCPREAAQMVLNRVETALLPDMGLPGVLLSQGR